LLRKKQQRKAGETAHSECCDKPRDVDFGLMLDFWNNLKIAGRYIMELSSESACKSREKKIGVPSIGDVLFLGDF
jgi:hypothetical protein